MQERIKFDNRADWLAGRMAQGIGASEASAIAGCGFISKIDLWKLKTGRTKPKDLSDNEAVREGNRMEGPIREFYKAMHPELTIEHHPYDIIFQKGVPWLFCTLDGEVVTENTKERGILEIKNVTPSGKAGWDEWNGRIPDKYYYQILHQMLATGYEFAVLVAALHSSDGSITIREYEFARGECFTDLYYYRQLAGDFMHYVIADQMPPVPIM